MTEPEEKPAEAVYSNPTLFVRNLPYDATNEELENFFSNLGPTRSCFVVLAHENDIENSEEKTKKKESVKNKGYGFVTYALAEDAKRAVEELKDVKFRRERKLKIEFAVKKGEKGSEASHGVTHEKKVRVRHSEENSERRKTSSSVIDSTSRRVIIEGLPSGVTQKQIYKKAKKSGDVEEVVFPVIEGSSTLENTAHVTYATSKNAQDAISHLDGHIFKGSTLKARPLNTPWHTGPDKNARLIVRNLPWKYRENELKELFSKYGTVAEVVVPRKFVGGPLRGFGFIQFLKKEDAEKAITTLNGTKHHGRTIAVDWALSKDKYYEAEHLADAAEEAAVNHKQVNDKNMDNAAEDEEESSENDVMAENQDDALDSELEGEDNDDEDVDSMNDNGDSDDEEEEEEEEEEDKSVNGEEDDNDDGESGGDNDDDEDEETEGNDDENSDKEEESIEKEKVLIQKEKNHLEGAGEKKTTHEKTMPSTAEGTTLFARNLSFDATEEEFYDLFCSWGKLRYARITKDRDTGHSRGTGFVCFFEVAAADACLADAEKVRKLTSASAATESNTSVPFNLLSKKQQKTHMGQTGLPSYRSILTADPSTGIASKFTIQGRVLDVVRAVERDEAGKLMEMNTRKREKEDKRNLYLIREGVIHPGTAAAASLSPDELRKREEAYVFRRQNIAKNPAFFISKTRLSIRNLPLKVDDKDLRKLGLGAIQKFKQETKQGERVDLTKEEKSEGWDKLPRLKQVKITRSKDRVDAETQNLRSKGYGFLEFTTHAHALAALRYLNNNPAVFGDKKRLIVEFSLENMDVIKRRQEKMIKSRISAKNNNNDNSNNNNNRDAISERKTKSNDNGNNVRKRFFTNNRTDGSKKRKIESNGGLEGNKRVKFDKPRSKIKK